MDNDIALPLDQKLSALMLRGWTLLAEVCPIEKCQCPLMRNAAKKVYCPNCETWIENNALQDIMAFIDLVPPKGKKNLPSNPKEPIESTAMPMKKVVLQKDKQSNECKVIQIHKDKLKWLSQSLETETDLTKIKWLLKDINLCIKNIKELND